jgi:hypothetical protein
MPETGADRVAELFRRKVAALLVLWRMPPNEPRNNPKRCKRIDPERRGQAPCNNNDAGKGWTDGTTDIEANAVESDGRLQMRSWDQQLNNRLPCRPNQRCRRCREKAESEDDTGRHSVPLDQQRKTHHQHNGGELHDDEKPTAIDNVGERSRRNGENEHRK